MTPEQLAQNPRLQALDFMLKRETEKKAAQAAAPTAEDLISQARPQPIVSPQQKTLDELIAQADAAAEKKAATLGRRPQPAPQQLVEEGKAAAAEPAAPRALPEEAPFDIPLAAKAASAPQQMTAAQINKRLDQIEKLDSALMDEMIAAGRGNEKPTDYLNKTDPLSQRARALFDERSALRNEIESRYGPGTPRRLPIERGKFGPSKILQSEKGAITLPGIGREDPLAALNPPDYMSPYEVGRRSLMNRARTVLNEMGPTGKQAAEKADAFYYNSQKAMADVENAIEAVQRAHPNVTGEEFNRQIRQGRASPEVIAAYRDMKQITDAIADEAEQLGVKVRNPITGEERAFQRRQRYIPNLLDRSKITPENSQYMVDKIAEGLIADQGMEPGAARTAAINMLRNASKKSGSLQMIRVGEFDPRIHIENAWDAYKQALPKEVERIEALKLFGQRDPEGLLGNELGGIRDLAQNISAEAGPAAAERAELTLRQALGMVPEGATIPRRFGQFLRNFNTLKLGFLPVTNLGPQQMQILAAGRTTAYNPLQALKSIKEAFGERGGYEAAKNLGVAIDRTSEDLLTKLDVSRGGPGGSVAQKFLDWTGSTKSENFVAKLASYVGQEDAKAVIQNLLDKPDSKMAQRAVKFYGLDPEKVIAEGMTEENLFKAGRHFADTVLLRPSTMDIPPVYSSESGKVFLQFKRATQTLAQQMLDALKYDPKKFIALVAASQVGGEALLDTKAGVRGGVAALFSGDPERVKEAFKNRPTDARRIVENFAAAISLGYLGDTATDLLTGKDPKTLISGGSVAFSPIETGMNLAQGAGKIMTGQEGGGKQIAGAISREVPGGTFFRELTRKQPTERQKMIRDLGLQDLVDMQNKIRRQRQTELEDLGLR